MPFTNETLYDPARIIIDREKRQRKEVVLDPPFLASIQRNGVIEPIIVHRETWHLVAGERRTMAARQLSISVPIRFFDTLQPSDIKLIELEENIKRSDLPWRDSVTAYSELHKIYTSEHEARGEKWSVEQSATELGIATVHLYNVLRIYANLNSPRLAEATSFRQALGILQRFADRKASAIVAEITAQGSRIFSLTPPQTGTLHGSASAIATVPTQPLQDNRTVSEGGPSASPAIPTTFSSISELSNGEASAISPSIPPPSRASTLSKEVPIGIGDFLQWAPAYSGEPFTFIHCDFPYGVNTADSLIESYENNAPIYWKLLDCLCNNASRLFSYSSHLMFWLSMRDDFFQTTKTRLRAAGFHVIDRPLIWLKSDGRGAAPGVKGTQPRHVYEAALLCSRGQRPLVKQGGDGYAAPSVDKPIHPTQKPEPMLRFFFQMLVDETTTFFDPTAGSGASLRAAEDLGARTANGLEMDEGYAAAANAETLRQRRFRSVRI